MSIEVITWALRVPVGGNAKVVLLGLANHAHPDGTESYPSLDTLAEYAACDRSTARRNVRKLVAEGWAIEDGTGPKGQTKYRLAVHRRGGSKMQPVADRHSGTDASGGVAPMPPEPSLEPSSQSKSARASNDDAVPADFPDELRLHARHVMRVLRDVAENRGARKVTTRAVALTITARPRKPLVKAAHDCAAWIADHPEVPCRDVVARYRRWLDNEADLAAIEQLTADGSSSSVPRRPPSGVTPIRRGGQSQWATLRSLAKIDGATEEQAVAYANSGGQIGYDRWASTQPDGGPRSHA